MPSGDSYPANKRTPNPESGTGDLESVQPQPKTTDESVDFGSYVSSTVRSSADLFGTPTRSSSSRNRGRRTEPEPAPSNPPDGDSVPAPSRLPRQRAARTSNTAATAESNRPRTYWRDSVAGDATSDEYADDRREVPENGGFGDRFGGMFPWKFPDDGRTRGIILGVVALAILALVLLLWFLNRGDDDDSPPPTGTVESVINAPGATDPPTESSGDASTPSGFIPFEEDETPEPEPEATEAVRRGGDNQLDRDDPGTPGARLDVPVSEGAPGLSFAANDRT